MAVSPSWPRSFRPIVYSLPSSDKRNEWKDDEEEKH